MATNYRTEATERRAREDALDMVRRHNDRLARIHAHGIETSIDSKGHLIVRDPTEGIQWRLFGGKREEA